MPDSSATPEAVTRAVLERPPPPGPGARLTPEQAAAQQIREEVQKKTPRSALEALRKPQPPERRGIDAIIEQSIGTERGADGRKVRTPGSSVENRFKDAKKFADLSRELLERGYNGLTVSQQLEARQLAQMVLMVWPEANAVLTDPTARQVAVEAILREPQFAAKLRGLFEGAIDPSKTLSDETASAIKTKLDDTQKKENEKRQEIARNDGEGNSVSAQLEQFMDRTGVGGGKGAKLAELEDIEQNLPALGTELTEKQDQLADANVEIRDLEFSRRVALQRGEDSAVIAVIDGELRVKRSEARTLQRDVSRISERISKKTALENERNTLQERRNQLNAERTRLEEEVRSLEQERVRVQAEYASAQLTRESQELDFVDSLRNLIPEATMQYLEEKITAAENAQRQLIEEAKAKTVDPAEKAILESLLERWDRERVVGILGRRMTREFNREQINADFGTLITAGPKEVMRAILAAKGFAAAEIDAKLNDPAFVEKMQPQAVERLVTRKIQTGKLSESDARTIIESDWGKGMIDKAIANRKEIRDALERLKIDGVLQGSVSEWFRRRSGGSLLKFLLILLGTIAFGAYPAVTALRSSLRE